jgi:hypothetical protein
MSGNVDYITLVHIVFTHAVLSRAQALAWEGDVGASQAAIGARQKIRRGAALKSEFSRQPTLGDLSTEDGRFLRCLLTEFSENAGLVADVYESTRRLEGLSLDRVSIERHARALLEVRRQK